MTDEPESGVGAVAVPGFESPAVWACAANDEASAPAAMNGTSLLLMVIDDVLLLS
jgi:hypothetical protein